MNDYPKKQLRHVFEIVSGSTPLTSNDDYWSGDIPWVTPDDLGRLDGYWLSDTARRITPAGYDASGTTLVPANSIVLSKRAPIGQLAVLDRPACSNQGCFLLAPTTAIDARYYYYWLSTRTEYLKALGRGSTFMELSLDDLQSIMVPCPDLHAQAEIADFLDATTTHLDELMSVILGLLDLLVEKHQAMATKALIRGLDEDVSLQDCGIPWIRKIPVHWRTEKARWLFRERNERSTSGNEELLTVSHLSGVTMRSEKDVNMFEPKTHEGYKICAEGDLVINTLWAWMGAMGISPMRGIVSPSYHVYEVAEKLDPSYVDALVRLPIFAQEVTRYSKGVWSSRLRLYPEGFFEVSLPVPPRTEQCEIMSFIHDEFQLLETLRIAMEHTIDLLKERRSALVLAAVTGQIDLVSVA